MNERRSEKPGRNDPCHCGADRKYKKCCERVEEERRRGPLQYEHISIKNTVLEEIRSFKEIFGVKLTDEELDVNKSITDSDVLLFVERVRNLWGSKADLLPQMPAALFGAMGAMELLWNQLVAHSFHRDGGVRVPPLNHCPFVQLKAWRRED